MAKDGQGDGFGTACIAQLVLHAVTERMDCHLGITNLGAQTLHEHGGGRITATRSGILGEDGCCIQGPNLLLFEALCGPV